MALCDVRKSLMSVSVEREGTNCESLPETHSFLREMREYVQKVRSVGFA